MKSATSPILVFAHSDVYFPEGWFARLNQEVERLNLLDPDWAVASIFGITASGNAVGRIWDSGLQWTIGRAVTSPVPIVSLDEVVFVVRRGSEMLFDPMVPDFHLYGTDLVLMAERRGKRSYGLDLPLVHNSKPVLRLGPDYVRSYKYMVRKWHDRLPVPTSIATLTANPGHLAFRRLQIRYRAIFRSSTYSSKRIEDPSKKARELGF
jgi:hypothetical protein